MAAAPAAPAAAVRSAGPDRPPALSGDGFLWPVPGEVVDGFGEKPNGQRNDGVNIAAPAGAPVRAAEHGVVVFAGDGIAGFGNLLLIRHADGFTTAYAHAEALDVRVGDVVERGQPVARVGTTGSVEEPQLHFELRAGRTPLDPLRHLVGRPRAVATTGG
jgi:murein DD-endopeptidase MepM/ murein hydrolase activator NlpD